MLVFLDIRILEDITCNNTPLFFEKIENNVNINYYAYASEVVYLGHRIPSKIKFEIGASHAIREVFQIVINTALSEGWKKPIEVVIVSTDKPTDHYDNELYILKQLIKDNFVNIMFIDEERKLLTLDEYSIKHKKQNK